MNKQDSKQPPRPCILCHSEKIDIIERVKKDDIIALYARAFGVNVAHIITSDLFYIHCGECDLRFFSLENGEIPTGDDSFYNALNQLEWYYMGQKHEYHFAKRFISGESKVLEVGCGKAAFAHFIPEKARKHYVGLEFSTQAKIMAKDNGINIENIFIEEYAKAHSGEFDVCCSFQVLEHTSNPYSFIKSQILALRSSNGGGGETMSRFYQY